MIWVDVELLQLGIMFLTAMKQLERLMELKYCRGFPGSTDYLKKLIRALPISSSSQMEHSMKCVFIMNITI